MKNIIFKGIVWVFLISFSSIFSVAYFNCPTTFDEDDEVQSTLGNGLFMFLRDPPGFVRSPVNEGEIKDIIWGFHNVDQDCNMVGPSSGLKYIVIANKINNSIGYYTGTDCSDTTTNGSCSGTRPYYCDEGNLIHNCTRCGCPGTTCNPATGRCTSGGPQTIYACQKISVPGNYIVPSDIVGFPNPVIGGITSFGCIDILSDDVQLDCNHSTISNNALAISAIYSEGKNTVIKNCNVSMQKAPGGYGIYLDGANNSQITNNTANSQGTGIYLESVDNVVVSGNTIKDNLLSGITLSKSTNNIIENNKANYNENNALFIHNGSFNQVVNMDVFSCNNLDLRATGIKILDSTQNTIRDSDIYACNFGITVSGPGKNDMDNNKIHEPVFYGIWSNNSIDSVIIRNEIKDANWVGIFVSDGKDAAIRRNLIESTNGLILANQGIARKVNKEKLKELVIKSGWKKEQVEKVFDEIENKKEKKTEVDIEKKIQLQKSEKEIKSNPNVKILEEYDFKFRDMQINVIIYSEKGKPNTFYHMIIPMISATTDLILEEIRLKLIDQINLGTLELASGDFEKLDTQVQNLLIKLVSESFPHGDLATQKFLASYLISKVLGLGIVELIKADENLEEIVINNSEKPIYVYHKKHGWCSTNEYLRTDDDILQLAQMTGRKIGREITTLVPLLDAHLPNGDRVNATIKPVTAMGPTMTIRKFTADPWTITKFLKTKTMDFNTAAIVWLSIQYELSILIVGGTASGKTSALNVLTNLIPPDQRVISIEDTREIRLPKFMHWVPMVSRAPNPEGKGGIEMEDLLVNSLRMRPDRIIVGEVRKRVQAETLFEAIHTGHSCYATFHANNAEEAIIRLTNPPVSVPKSMMPAVSLMLVQFRNRRTGLRRTFQLAEVTKLGDVNIIYQYDAKTDTMQAANKSTTLFETLALYTGNTIDELKAMMQEKIKVLKYLVNKDITSVEGVGKVMSLYYTEKDYLMNDIIGKNKDIGE